MKPSRDTIILAVLTLLATALVLLFLWKHKTTNMEAVGFVTGALCVWLTVKESAWNFPLSLINPVAYFIVFYNAYLFADMTLQVAFFILTLVGWYLWLFGGNRFTPLRVSRCTPAGVSISVVATAALTAAWWPVLIKAHDSLPLTDALFTSLQITAQWLLNSKRLENWYYWILADIVAVPLFLYKSLYLTALLFAIFLVMATIGLFGWRALWRRQMNAPGFPVLLSDPTA